MDTFTHATTQEAMATAPRLLNQILPDLPEVEGVTPSKKQMMIENQWFTLKVEFLPPCPPDLILEVVNILIQNVALVEDRIPEFTAEKEFCYDTQCEL